MADRRRPRATTHRPGTHARDAHTAWDTIAANLLAENERMFGIAPHGGDAD